MKYLVTSGTGGLATKAIEVLIELVGAENVVTTARSLEKAQRLTELGVEVRQADYLDKDSLVQAFKGIDRLLFVSSNVLDRRREQHQNVVDAAVENDVSFIVYTSMVDIKGTGFLTPDHTYTEEIVAKSGLNYAISRHNWYFENEAALFKAIQDNGQYRYTSGDGKVGWVTRDDLAEADARILAGVAPEQQIYEMSGEPITYVELATELEAGTDKHVEMISLTDPEYITQMRELGMSEGALGFVLRTQKDFRNGVFDVENSDLEKVLERPQTKLTLPNH